MTRALVTGSAAGVLFAAALIGLVFATGQTFGQRCEKVYPENTQAYTDCVERLVRGGKERTP